jgi:ABC-2 type transport system permease protein
VFYRNTQGFYWTIFMPAIIYVALSILPIGAFIHSDQVYSSYILPGVVAMTIMQTGIYGLAYWVIDLKTMGVIKRFLVTPLRPSTIVFSLVASRLVIILVEIIALTFIGKLFFNVPFAGNIISTIVIALLGGAIFLCLGLLIANYARSYDAAAPITSAIGLPLTFLGNIFYPITLLPAGLQTVAKLLPITYLADGLRQAYLYPFALEQIGKDILVLCVWLIIMLGATLVLFRLKEQ